MSEYPVSTDPRFRQWPSTRVSSVLNQNVTCMGYAAASDETLAAVVRRGAGLQRAPELGNASGIPWQLYSMAHGATAQSACRLAERDGMIPVRVQAHEPLPQVPAGQLLVAMFMGHLDGSPEYHWARHFKGISTSKMGHGQLPKMTDSHGRLIRDPRQARFYENQQGPFFFFIPEQGIDMRLKPGMEDLLDAALLEQRRMRNTGIKTSPVLAQHFMQLARLCAPVDPAVGLALERNADICRIGKRPGVPPACK